MNRRLPNMPRDRLPAMIESILFVAEVAVDLDMLSRAVRKRRADVEAALIELEQRCAEGGTRLQRNGDFVQLVTAPECGPYVERFLGLESKQRLSGAALEALAIIAYKQPVTRAGVEAVRGVNSDGAIASLIGRGLIEDVGKAPGPGRPTLLGTTLRFLEHFGLKNPADLPPMPGVTDGVETGFQTPLARVAVTDGDQDDGYDDAAEEEAEDAAES
ncbi:MAG TPA: SMC-Scp complex subunit ScpB [Dehalococcoidia bacterium]|nr:SMC-Scp complex subunit ScpB [Dehalococcoidia bacterium]